MRLFFMIVMSCALLSSAFAQEETEEFIGLGPKGRYTMEQGQRFVFQVVSGQILETNLYRQNDRVFYVYKVLAPDKSIYDVDINALTGEIVNIQIEYLADGAALPFPVISGKIATELALPHVFKETKGKRKPKLLSAKITSFDRKPVYAVQVKKAARKFEVMVHARDGGILNMNEID